jgi:DNA-binding transcriptional MocR family regulator
MTATCAGCARCWRRNASAWPRRLGDYFPAGTRTTLPAGGLHLWVEVPGVSSARLFEAALEERILVTPGTLFSNTGRFENYLRLGCGWPYSQRIDDALKTLGRIAARLG